MMVVAVVVVVLRFAGETRMDLRLTVQFPGSTLIILLLHAVISGPIPTFLVDLRQPDEFNDATRSCDLPSKFVRRARWRAMTLGQSFFVQKESRDVL